MQRTLLASTSLVAALLGCAPARPYAPLGGAARSSALTVENDHWLDMVVYAVRGSSRFRLGSVPGLGHATLWLPRDFFPDGTVRLLADPIGSRERYLSDAILVQPGERVELRIGSVLSQSTYSVWTR